MVEERIGAQKRDCALSSEPVGKPGKVVRYQRRGNLSRARRRPCKHRSKGERIALKRFVITGAPGAGKTAILRQLELDGFSVVEEAATDVIAVAQARGTPEPWANPSFVDAVANLQRVRQVRASGQPGEIQFHDRCAVCTAALAAYLGYPVSPFLKKELERIKKEAIYQDRVFLIRNLGFITPTEARRISFEETVRFEKIHEEIYSRFGFELVQVEPGDLLKRVEVIRAAIS